MIDSFFYRQEESIFQNIYFYSSLKDILKYCKYDMFVLYKFSINYVEELEQEYFKYQ